MTKKVIRNFRRQNGNFSFKKVIRKLGTPIFFPSPKLGAKSPPMTSTNTYIAHERIIRYNTIVFDISSFRSAFGHNYDGASMSLRSCRVREDLVGVFTKLSCSYRPQWRLRLWTALSIRLV